MLDHTFLFKEGLWRCEGEFLDGTGKATRVAGEAQIRHYPDKWVYEGTLRTDATPPVRPTSRRPGATAPRTPSSGAARGATARAACCSTAARSCRPGKSS